MICCYFVVYDSPQIFNGVKISQFFSNSWTSTRKWTMPSYYNEQCEVGKTIDVSPVPSRLLGSRFTKANNVFFNNWDSGAGENSKFWPKCDILGDQGQETSRYIISIWIYVIYPYWTISSYPIRLTGRHAGIWHSYDIVCCFTPSE